MTPRRHLAIWVLNVIALNPKRSDVTIAIAQEQDKRKFRLTWPASIRLLPW
jgi:hypothetical protein